MKGTSTPIKLALNPDLYLGETYMDGTLRLEREILWDFANLLAENLGTPSEGILLQCLRPFQNWLTQLNTRGGSRKNAARHYGLSESLYRLFLDNDLQYSCAYFSSPALGLDAAQEAKKLHLATKLRLRPGQRTLDIGCGWGGLAITLARMADVEVRGITLSQEQLDIAHQRATEAGRSNRVKFELVDFRDVSGQFDRIISVGMFEHVGLPNYPTFFDRVRDLLVSDGVAVLHSIGRMHGPSSTSLWIRKYIFPGGYAPALSQVLPAIERSGMWLTDLEILRLHYAETLRLWRQRFSEHRNAVEALYGERFCRMWEFYLAISELSFRHGGFMVFQMQLSKDILAVPLTRDYLFEFERDACVSPELRVAPT